MKLKKIIASGLIFIIVMSSMGCYAGFSQDQVSIKADLSASATQLIADTQDPSHEFREGFKTHHTTQVSSLSFSLLYTSSLSTFEVVRHAQYGAYLQKQLFERPTPKLFIAFGSLII